MVGQSLGRYTIESKLGEGGMGVVFKARDAQLGRAVAIKILPPDKIADPDRKRRFIQEAKAASALNHPHIVTIYDIGSDAGTDFMVMEYLDGTTLDQRVPANGLPQKQALAIGIAIADALAAAHEAGIVHRDLKPSNVIVTSAGLAKVLDFGVAKLLEAEPSAATRTAVVTEEGTAIGTPAYMSPEQADGRKIDSRSDIFSFGSVLYEMVTGRKAFPGESRLSVLAKILNDEPTVPSRIQSTIPPELEKTILRCLRKDPARRFQTMADLKVALEDLASDLSGSAPSQVQPRRSAFRFGWLAAGLGAIAIGGVAFVDGPWRAAPVSAPLQAVPLTSLSGLVRMPSLSPDGNHVAFSWSGPNQDNPDVYVQQVGVGTQLRLTRDAGNDYSPSWSPDGRTIAFLRRGLAAGKSELRLIAPLGGPERKVAEIESVVAAYRPPSISWCPDSTCILAVDSTGAGKPDAVFAIAIANGEKRQVTFPVGAYSDSDAVMSPDGRSLVFRRDATPFSGSFYRLPLTAQMGADGELVRLTETLSAGKPVWTPDGREILFAARGALWRLDAFTGGSPTRLPFVGEDGGGPVVSRMPDGRQRLVYLRSFSDGNIWRVNTPAAGAPATTLPQVAIASTRSDFIPTLAPNEQQVAFLSNRSGESEIWVAAPDGSNAVQLTSLGATPGFPRWSPDGRFVAFHGDPNHRPDVIVVPAGGGEPRIMTANMSNSAFPSYSRDGKWIYFTSGDKGPTSIWKLPAGGGPAVPVTGTVGAISVESPDGRDLYYVEAAERPSAVWRFPLAGGTPVKVLDGVIFGNFDVVEGGIYYIDRVAGSAGGFFVDRARGETRLQYFDFATRKTTTVAHNLGAVGAGLSVSRDGRTIFYSRVDSSVDELMLVENFR